MKLNEKIANWLVGDSAASEVIIPMGSPSQWRNLMRFGNNGPDVAAWQTVLLADNLDISDQVGVFGQSTHNASMSFQLEYGLTTDGLVGPKTRAVIGTDKPSSAHPAHPVLDSIPFVEAVNWSRQVAPRDSVDWVVIHCMEGTETSTRAERCASRFVDPANAPKASCHYCVDCDSIVQCVKEDRIAWHAPGANKRGIGIEHAGFARQNRAQWLDTYGQQMLKLSATLTASICKRWNIPLTYVNANGLRNGKRGITMHVDVSRAFKKSSHWDPGPHWPMDWYLQQARDAKV